MMREKAHESQRDSLASRDLNSIWNLFIGGQKWRNINTKVS
jgi:hypothetical protein